MIHSHKGMVTYMLIFTERLKPLGSYPPNGVNTKFQVFCPHSLFLGSHVILRIGEWVSAQDINPITLLVEPHRVLYEVRASSATYKIHTVGLPRDYAQHLNDLNSLPQIAPK
jgi:hypothetical protein